METLSGDAACTDVGSSFDRPVAGELSCNAGVSFQTCSLFKVLKSLLKFDLIFLHEKNVSTLAKMSIHYNPRNNSHFLLLQDYLPAVANWLNLRSYIFMGLWMKVSRNTLKSGK
jgi:hypothetical protein